MISARVRTNGFIFALASGGTLRAAVGLVMLMAAGPVPAQITTRDDKVGRMLNEWHAKGRAAGLASITYENRDGGHSPLNTAQYPQLQVFKPGEKSGNLKGPAEMLRQAPTIGNCSMAAPAVNGGSLPRFYQISPKGAQFLMLQYVANQLFVYPEHQDYDIGANGIGGYGDLYPVNSATTLISQGSSGSDLPFVNAILTTIAALPPDTQDILIQSRILMPTVQSIFRQSNRMVVSEEDYFTGAAHPPVFNASRLDEEKMILTANDMTPAKIPPMVQIQVKEETALDAGRHYFESPEAVAWKLADTPVAIARIMRGNVSEYEISLTAVKSGDRLRRPLQVRWQLLQGRADSVQIVPSESGTEARVRVRWQPPIITATGVRSHRTDIGVFATNGISTSAPAFISLYQ
ncbi:MAG TPA: hypothetical protein VD994_19080, partial [Prosthecobacter sp.]|nr:hypothetical protein [Prosthecobacter sp.]